MKLERAVFKEAVEVAGQTQTTWMRGERMGRPGADLELVFVTDKKGPPVPWIRIPPSGKKGGKTHHVPLYGGNVISVVFAED